MAHCKEYQVISHKDKGMATKRKKLHLCSAAKELNLDRAQLRKVQLVAKWARPPFGFMCKDLLQLQLESAGDDKNMASEQCYLQS